MCKKLKKRIRIVIVTIMLLLSACNSDGNKNESETTKIDNDINEKSDSKSMLKLVTSYNEYTTVDEMETIKFGQYPQLDNNSDNIEPIEWIVLDKQGNKILLFSKYILDCKFYNDAFWGCTWEDCSLRKWLNDDFYNKAFNNSEQKKIQDMTVINNDNEDYDVEGGNDTIDKIFCLSIDEVKTYFNQPHMFSDNERLATRGTKYARSVSNSGWNLDYVKGKSF